MRIRILLSVAVAVCCLASNTAVAKDPMYESWAKHKPGTTVVINGTSEVAGMKNETEQTFTLKEVTPAKCVVEVKMSMTTMGNKSELPATTMDVPAEPPAGQPGAMPAPPEGAKTETKQENVTVAGKEYKATCTTIKVELNGVKTESTIWTSPEVPGMTLRMESKAAGASAMKSEVTKVETK